MSKIVLLYIGMLLYCNSSLMQVGCKQSRIKPRNNNEQFKETNILQISIRMYTYYARVTPSHHLKILLEKKN